MEKTFEIILLIARPAAGKSEIIDFLKKTPLDERAEKYHIGKFEELDDFPILWRWFEEDHFLREMGLPALYTDEEGYFNQQPLWNLLIRLICLDYSKKLRDDKNYHAEYSTIIEFARGTEHGGFQEAFQHLTEDVIKKMGILYLNVPWEESLRKNRARFNPDKPDSILEHGLPDKKLEKLYRHNDWEEITKDDPTHITVKGVKVPYVVFDNGDDVTSKPDGKLENRLTETLQKLWELKSK